MSQIDKSVTGTEERKWVRRWRNSPSFYDRTRYKLRNVVERFFNRAKHHQRVATRYDKTDSSDFSFVCLASIMTNLSNDPTTLRCLRDYFFLTLLFCSGYHCACGEARKLKMVASRLRHDPLGGMKSLSVGRMAQ